jgi:hypothetical protein
MGTVLATSCHPHCDADIPFEIDRKFCFQTSEKVEQMKFYLTCKACGNR